VHVVTFRSLILVVLLRK